MHGGSFNLHEWHEFYLLLGTVAGALVALLFVAVSVAVGYLTDERSIATRFSLTPIVKFQQRAVDSFAVRGT